jgi:hypothetical protein
MSGQRRTDYYFVVLLLLLLLLLLLVSIGRRSQGAGAGAALVRAAACRQNKSHDVNMASLRVLGNGVIVSGGTTPIEYVQAAADSCAARLVRARR